MNPAPDLPLSTHRLVFEAETTMRLPEHLGSAWRGAFGHALKRSVCIQRLRPCPGCLVERTCLYPTLFETSPGPDARKMRRYERIPHPFAIAPAGWGARTLEAGRTIQVALVLVGRASAHVPYVVHALVRAAALGIGPDRGRLRLVTADRVAGPWADAPVTARGLDAGAACPALPPCPPGCRVELETPARLKHRGLHVGPDQFAPYDLLMTLVRRITMLAEFHASPVEGTDFRALKAEASAARLLDASLHWRELTRRSSRQGTVMQMGGLLGTARLDLTEAPSLWPYLWLGQWVGAGNGTTMGLGRYRIASAMG